ncbi:unnamed protein product, partial [Mesorhabditis spiculigera]
PRPGYAAKAHFRLMMPPLAEIPAGVAAARTAIEGMQNLVLGKHPTPGKLDELLRCVVEKWCTGTNPAETISKNEQFVCLLRWMLERNPDRRPHASQCLQDQYLAEAAKENSQLTTTIPDEARNTLHAILRQSSQNVHVQPRT